MTTLHLVIVCATVLAVAGIVAWVVQELVKDSTSTRLVLEQKAVEAAHAQRELELTAKSGDARAMRELELTAEADEATRERAAHEEHALDGRAVLINTTGATAVRGVVHADLPDRITLRSATVLSGGHDAEAPVGGLLHIYRSRIDLVQEITAPEPEGG